MTQPNSPGGEYEAKSYWSQRLEEDFSLVGVGYKTFGAAFNRWQYKGYLRNLQWAEKKFRFDLARERILECGFGTGFFLDYYHRRGNTTFSGIDLTDISVKSISQRYPHNDFRQADLGGSDFDLGQTFDIVTAFAVLLHITDDAMFEAAVANLCRHSHNLVLITDLFPRKRFQKGAASHNVIRSYGEYVRQLEANGFEVAGMVPVFAFLSAPRPTIKFWFFFWSGILRLLTLTEFTGGLAGALFYGLDGLLIGGLRLDISLRLLVARKKSA
jgi:2-polyprenyl-3-methyl-5-hydroxy-6-metoxy-1,4-benzoquinol methylase